MFKAFVCVQRAITRMQDAILDKVRVQWTWVPGGLHKSDVYLKFRPKVSHKSVEYASNSAKLFKTHIIMPRECFPIIPAWFAAHNSGLRWKNHEKSWKIIFFTFWWVSPDRCWSMSKSHVDQSERPQTLETRLKRLCAFKEPSHACRMHF